MTDPPAPGGSGPETTAPPAARPWRLLCAPSSSRPDPAKRKAAPPLRKEGGAGELRK